MTHSTYETNSVITTPINGGCAYKELIYLMEKSQTAALDLWLFKHLNKMVIETNNVESTCSKLVKSKLIKEWIYEERHDKGVRMNLFWRNKSLLLKLAEHKVKEVKKFWLVLKKKL